MRSGCFSRADQLVVGEQVGRVGHADEQAARVRLQHQRAEAARLRFGQQAHGLLIERQLAHVDERDLQVRARALVAASLRARCPDR